MPEFERGKMFRLFAGLALVYVFFAGLHSVNDFDLGWQIAGGRQWIETGHVPARDELSYTARGAEFIYPPVSGAIFYETFKWGGYGALSWMSLAASLLAVFFLVRGQTTGTAVLAILAVPAIVYRTNARAELFSTIFFAAVFGMLWRRHRGESDSLVALPIIMLAWVNLHLGFVAGLAAILGYAFLEIGEMLFADRRAPAVARLRSAVPYLAGAGLATLINPWGPNIYSAIVRQDRSMNELGDFIGEWARPQINWATLREATDILNPDSSFWCLLVLCILCIGVALWKKQFAGAAMLGAACVLSLRYLRFQGLFACVAVILAGSLLESVATLKKQKIQVALAIALALLVSVRIADLVTNRYYLRSGQTALFGPGPSWWYPQRAAEFLLHERLPGNVLNPYNLGGFLDWRIGTNYPVYADSRVIPFGTALLLRQQELFQMSPDSPAFLQEADARGIQTVFVSAARYAGLGTFPLVSYCNSREWQPVYMDEVSAIFVRTRPENGGLLTRNRIDCSTISLQPPAAASKGELFNFHANASALLYVLKRDVEALEHSERALELYAGDGNLQLTRAQIFESMGKLTESRQAYETATRLKPSDITFIALARFYARQKEYVPAAAALQQS
ncbi:MAG: hypothetical protein HY046_08575, partial [Acidobacteria bacterium]|nr:hypothetical protein [Acidobacteriota bacterium]